MARLFDDGSTEYLLNNTAPITDYPFAMACRFRTDEDVADQQLIWLGNKDAGAEWVGLFLIGGDKVVRAFTHTYGGVEGVRAANSSAQFTNNTWQHAAGIWLNRSESHAYLEGGNKGSDTIETGLMVNHDRVAIGTIARDSGFNSFMSGEIAEVGIWDLTNWGANDAEREVNFEKVIASLAKGFTPDNFPLGLVAYWNLIRGLNDKFSGYNLTASGTVVAAHPRIIQPCGVL